MNWGRRSIEIQRALAELVRQKHALNLLIRQKRQQLHAMSPKRPHTGCTSDVRKVLVRPMLASEIADALPDRERNRVQVILHQMARKGQINRVAIDRVKGRRGKWMFSPKEQS
jgi:hypothetical protein